MAAGPGASGGSPPAASPRLAASAPSGSAWVTFGAGLPLAQRGLRCARSGEGQRAALLAGSPRGRGSPPSGRMWPGAAGRPRGWAGWQTLRNGGAWHASGDSQRVRRRRGLPGQFRQRATPAPPRPGDRPRRVPGRLRAAQPLPGQRRGPGGSVPRHGPRGTPASGRGGAGGGGGGGPRRAGSGRPGPASAGWGGPPRVGSPRAGHPATAPPEGGVGASANVPYRACHHRLGWASASTKGERARPTPDRSAPGWEAAAPSSGIGWSARHGGPHP
jgi:translation initiation factor IF-2